MKTRLGLILMVVAVVGFLVVVVPAIPGEPSTVPRGTFPPYVAQAVESAGPVSLPLLGIVGFLAGYARPVNGRRSGAAWIAFVFACGVASVLGLFLWSLADMVIGNGSSHNLWPIEWAIYSLMGIPASIGAAVGLRIRR